MCKYCEFDEHGLNEEVLMAEGKVNEEVMNLYKASDGIVYICIEESSTEPWFEIKNCPMCGRNL